MSYTNLLPNTGFVNTTMPVILEADPAQEFFGGSAFNYLASDPSAAYSMEQTHIGLRSIKVTGWRNIILTQDVYAWAIFPCAPGATFYAEAWVRKTSDYQANSGHCRIDVRWLTSDAPTFGDVRTSFADIDYIGIDSASAATDGWVANAWTKISGFFQAPEDAHGYVLSLYQDQRRRPVPGEYGDQSIPNTFYWADPAFVAVTQSEYDTQTLSSPLAFSSSPPGVDENMGVNDWTAIIGEWPAVPDDPNELWSDTVTVYGMPPSKAIPNGAITAAPAGQVPEGSNYYSLTELAAKTSDDLLAPIKVRETKRWRPFQKLTGSLRDAILGLPIGSSGGANFEQIYLALTGWRDHTNETFKTALAAKLANEAAVKVTDFKAAAGTNLVASPHFSVVIPRFPMNAHQVSGYAVGAGTAHSGVQSWTWEHYAGWESGLQLAPTTSIAHFDVDTDEVYLVEAWVRPDSAATGTIRIGGTFYDPEEVLEDKRIYSDFTVGGADMVVGQYNKVNIEITVPTGYSRAIFWVGSTASSSGRFWVDDVLVRERTDSAAAKKQADFANEIVKLKAMAGSNLVIDPKFSTTCARFPYNVAEECGLTTAQDILDGLRPHSGVRAWKWIQETSAACGLILAPTAKETSFQVTPGEKYFTEAWIHPGTSTGSIKIGATLTDSSGDHATVDIADTWSMATQAPAGQWTAVSATVEIPTGFDVAKFWVIADSSTPAGVTMVVDDVTVREITMAARAREQADIANAIVDMKARAGSNLVYDPRFTSRSVTRFRYGTSEETSYTTLEDFTGGWRPHSGLLAWKWTHSGSDSGFSMAPTPKVELYQVDGGERYTLEAWIRPRSGNSGTGQISIGVTCTDTSGTLEPTSVQSSTDLSTMSSAAWSKVATKVEIPAGYDVARFWVISTGAAEGDVLYIDDANLRESTESVKAQEQIDFADAIVTMKARAGSNLVYDPKFSNNKVFRFKFDPDGVGDYTSAEDFTGGWRPHSGLLAWKWTHSGSDSGFVLAPTPKVELYQVDGGEKYTITAWVRPKSGNSGTGSISLGVTCTDTGEELPQTSIQSSTPLAGMSGWTKVTATVEIPAAYDTARFWVISTGAAEGDVLYIDDANLRESTESVKAQIKAEIADKIVTFKAKAGINLVIDPKFTAPSIDRFPYLEGQTCGFSTLSDLSGGWRPHSGLASWKWTQSAGAECGFIMAPTPSVDTFEVHPGTKYFLQAWIYPSGSSTTGNILIGATFTDEAGLHSPVSVYETYNLSTQVPPNQWNTVTATVEVPDNYEIARFWVIADSGTETGRTIFLDDVTCREQTDAQAIAAGIHQAVNGGTTGTVGLGTVKENLQNSWKSFWEGLSGLTATGAKTPGDVKTVAGTLRNDATTAKNDASDAKSGNTLTNRAVYNGFFGSGATGTPTEVSDTIAAIKTKLANGFTIETITYSMTGGAAWERPWAIGDPTAPTEFWVIAIGSGSGGGKGVANASGDGSTRVGGVGGAGGRWLAKQVDPGDVSATVEVTIGAAGAGDNSGNGNASPDNGADTSFGSYCATTTGITASIASSIGYYSCEDSRPGKGGDGGGFDSHNGLDGDPTPLAAGGAGGSGDGAAGSVGANASMTESTRAGGGGGGGGAYAPAGTADGGNGANGGWPGGGGGGGGACLGTSGHGGNGGYGSAGAVILLWK